MGESRAMGFHTLRGRSDDKLSDLRKYRNQIDAKTDGILLIKDAISELLWQMHLRLNQPRFEPFAEHDRFARSTLYAGFDLIAPIFGFRAEDIQIRAVLVDIKEFLPRLAQLVNDHLIDDAPTDSRLSSSDWSKISVVLAAMHEATPTISEALTLACILKWSLSNGGPTSHEAINEPVAEFHQHIEDVFLADLQSAAARLTSAIGDNDVSTAITIIMEIRANFVLDPDLLSSQFAEWMAAPLREIATVFDAFKERVTTSGESLAYELSSSTLTLNWANADVACKQLGTIASQPNIELALDVNHQINYFKMKRAAAFAAFLYAGPARLALTQREMEGGCISFLEMQDEVEYECLPTGSIRNILTLARSNEADALLLLTKSLSVKDLVPSVQKTIRYILTSSYWTAAMANESLWSLDFLKGDDQDAVLSSKFLLEWFAPSILVSALLFPEESGAFAVVEAGHVFDWGTVFKECNVQTCANILRALDQTYPDHPPILFGHILNMYANIVGAYGTAPLDFDGMLKVFSELYDPKANNVRNRLQKSLLHLQAQSVVDKVEAPEAKNFLRGCYERSGIIITDEFCTLLGTSKIKSSISAEQVNVAPLPIPSNMAKGWEKYHDRYSRLNSIETLAIAADKFIAKESRALVGQIKEATFTEKNPLRSYTSPHVPKDLSGHGDIIDVLIQRRAVLRWAQVCELRRDDKANSRKRTSFFQSMGYGSTNLDSYSNYFHSIGLKLENLVEPDESGFFPEELAWLKSFRTRK